MSVRALHRSLALFGAAAALAVAPAGSARAGDGGHEINAACVAIGCFPGDTAGFPVQTQSGRKYVLTSDLVLPTANTSGVTLADGATLDLNGFAITGVTTCTGIPAACANTGSGDGVTLGEGATLRNGAIRGMGDEGVIVAKLVLLEDLWIDQNGGNGVQGAVAHGTIVRGCRISRNGRTGVDLAGGDASPGSSIIENVIYANGEEGIQVNSAVILGNNIRSNGTLGIAAGYIDSSSGLAQNVINDNNGGNANPQMSGGQQTGTNVCGANTSCP